MLVLVGGAVVGAVVVSALVVGVSVRVVVGAGATGSVVVAGLEDGAVVGGVVVTADVVDDLEGDVAPPPWVSSRIPQITTATRMTASTPKPIKTAGLRCHGVDPGSGCWCPSP
jgi:hypothetical protein